MTTRTAIVYKANADTVARYLPGNYDVDQQVGEDVLISGSDQAGWTLDDYVIPRLLSGMIRCTEYVGLPPKRLQLGEKTELIEWLCEIESRTHTMIREVQEYGDSLEVNDASTAWDDVSVMAGNLASIATTLWPEQGTGPIS